MVVAVNVTSALSSVPDAANGIGPAVKTTVQSSPAAGVIPVLRAPNWALAPSPVDDPKVPLTAVLVDPVGMAALMLSGSRSNPTTDAELTVRV
jgi:hypothetical protein